MKLVHQMFMLPWQQEILHRQCTRLIVGSVEYKPLKMSSESGPCSGVDPLIHLSWCVAPPRYLHLLPLSIVNQQDLPGSSFVLLSLLLVLSRHNSSLRAVQPTSSFVVVVVCLFLSLLPGCVEKNKIDTNDREISAVLSFIIKGEFLLDAFWVLTK